ncbi:Bifunctional inhibitor/plant lipid transfer protein/seed storage helical domain [Dillenia turbinata]|uniref:Bifunctional inhibitor/plant lipid transfer protein/seed storage helical domain n=1 Tax=Dillenia turbinata TaxID=194707 RepID=A0AAN8VUK9_9MAGN
MAEVSLCNMSEDDLMSCKPAVTEPNPVDPSPECCKAVMGANLTCLCSYKNSLWLPILGIDPDLAMQLAPKLGNKYAPRAFDRRKWQGRHLVQLDMRRSLRSMVLDFSYRVKVFISFGGCASGTWQSEQNRLCLCGNLSVLHFIISV